MRAPEAAAHFGRETYGSMMIAGLADHKALRLPPEIEDLGTFSKDAIWWYDAATKTGEAASDNQSVLSADGRTKPD